MFIYISGPYAPPSEERDAQTRKKIAEENVANANSAALAIADMGHIPFVPHTMLLGWEDDASRDLVMHICHRWLEKCDALYFIGPSQGADSERELARLMKIPIYYEFEDIPKVEVTSSSSKLSSEAFQGYLVEYEQCMESYRHTYATIWQAGALFAAISAAIVTFAGSDNSNLQVLAPLPIIFWYLGIFQPMNRYGEVRNDRLVQLEQTLGTAIRDLQMQHFRYFSGTRKAESTTRRILLFKWLWRPRVKEIVTMFGVALIVVEFYLIAKLII